MTVDEELRRGREAKMLMESQIFQEARKHLEGQMAQLRRTVPISATDMHTRLILMGQIADQFFGYFEQLAQTGRMAEMHLEEIKQRRSFFERGVAAFRTSGRSGL